MEKFICTKCKKIWYTANTQPNQKCDSYKSPVIKFKDKEV